MKLGTQQLAFHINLLLYLNTLTADHTGNKGNYENGRNWTETQHNPMGNDHLPAQNLQYPFLRGLLSEQENRGTWSLCKVVTYRTTHSHKQKTIISHRKNICFKNSICTCERQALVQEKITLELQYLTVWCVWLTTYHPCSAESREDLGP
jgi:hypothetical protein